MSFTANGLNGGPVLLNVRRLTDEHDSSSFSVPFNITAPFRKRPNGNSFHPPIRKHHQAFIKKPSNKIAPMSDTEVIQVVPSSTVKNLQQQLETTASSTQNNSNNMLQIIDENDETQFKNDLKEDCYVDINALRQKAQRQKDGSVETAVAVGESPVESYDPSSVDYTRIPIPSSEQNLAAEKEEDTTTRPGSPADSSSTFSSTASSSFEYETGSEASSGAAGSDDSFGVTRHKAHKRSWTESPFLCCLSPCLPSYYKLRGHLLHNSFFDYRVPFPCLQALNRAFTIGELIMLFIIAGLTIAFSVLTFAQTYGMKLTGILTGFPLLFCIALGTRNSVFTFLLGIPFERQLFWHKVFCFVTIVFTWVHGAVSYLGYQEDGTINRINSCGPDGVRDCSSGWSFGAVLTVFPLLSIWYIRRKFYSIFKVIHVLLLLAIFGLGCYHFFQVGIVIAAFLWGIDLIIRYVYLVLVHAPYKCQATHLPSDIIRLTFPNPKKGKLRFRYSAGQYVFIMIPQLNPFEWHPFSISSSPHDDFVSIHIRVLGDWTARLQRHLKGLETQPNKLVEIKAFFEGPYGAPELDIESDKYKLFLLISGGIGITPMQSIANSLNHQKKGGRDLKKVMFIWTCGDKFMVNQVLMDREDQTKWWDTSNGREVQPMEFELDKLPVLSLDPDLLERRTNWQQQQLESGVVLHTEFYLTRSSASRMHSVRRARIRPDLESCIKFNRPDWDKIFETMKTYAWAAEEPRVAVLACGPEKLIQEARRLCGEKSDWKVSFDFHAESFDF